MFVPIRQNFLWGFADTLGNEIYPPTFEFVSGSVSKGFFVASKNGKYGLITYPNELLIPFEYESIKKVSQQLVELNRNDSVYLYHIDKKQILPLLFNEIRPIENSKKTFYSYKDGDRIGLLDKNGEVLLKASFDSYYTRRNFLVFVNSGYHYIYKDSMLLNPCPKTINYMMYSDSTTFVVSNKAGEKSLFFPYSQNSPLIDFERSQTYRRNKKITVLSTRDSVTFYNSLFQVSAPRNYQKYYEIDSTHIIVTLNDSTYGMINDKFEEILPFKYKKIYNMWNGLLNVTTGNKIKLFYIKSNNLSDFEYDEISYFKKGVAVFINNKKFGLLNQFGIDLAPAIYTSYDCEEKAYTFKNKDHALWVLTDNQGNLEKERRFAHLETISLKSSMDFIGVNLDSVFNQRERRRPRLFDSTSVFEDPAGRYYVERVSVGVLGYEIFGLRDYLTRKKIVDKEYWAIHLQDLKRSDYMTATLDGGRKVFIHYTGRVLSTAKYWDGFRVLERPILRLDTLNERGYSVFAAGSFRRQKVITKEPELPQDVKWGLINNKGKTVIPAKFQEIKAYKNGYLICKSNNQYGVVNERGDTIVGFEYHDISFLEGSNESVFLVKKFNPKYGVVSNVGDELTNVVFKEIKPYSENFAAIRHPDFEGWNFINRRGEIVQSTYYQRMNEFSEGLLAIRQKNKWGFIDTLGNVVIDFQYEQVGNFKNGLCPVKKFKELGWVYLNKQQETVLERFDKAYDFDRGLAVVSKNGKLKLIDLQGKIHCTFPSNKTYQYLMDWEAYQVLVDNNKITFFDSSGNVVIPNEKEAPIVSGFKKIKVESKYGYINGYGNWLVKPKFVAAEEFVEDKAAVKLGSLWGFIDFTGEIKLKPQFKSLSSFHQNLAYGVDTKGKKKYISSTFDISDSYLGDFISENNDLYISSSKFQDWVSLDDDSRKYSVYRSDGRKLFAASFHYIGHFDPDLAIVANYHRTNEGNLEFFYGLVNKYGYLKTPVIYDKITKDINGDYLVYKSAFSGVIDGLGNTIIPTVYEQIEKMPDCNLYQVREGGKVGYINTKGEMIWEPKR